MSFIDPSEVQKQLQEIRRLSNGARFAQAHRLAKRLLRAHPDVLEFAYAEAVMTAEDDYSFSPAKVRARNRLAARKFRALLRRMRVAPAPLKARVRNEYYWFSNQPHKQHRLGIEQVKAGNKRAYYSQGVGAAQVAKKYGLQGRKSLCAKWAKVSEKAWLDFFKQDSNWFNSSLFYAMALGFQGRTEEMERALARAAKIAGKSRNWLLIRKLRREINEVLKRGR